MPRHGQNSTCFVKLYDEDRYHLGSVVFLPPCASFMYYLEWNEGCHMDLPNFVFWDVGTPSDLLSESFTFKKIEVTNTLDIIFVQLVLGPAPRLSYVCHFNHFDGALELLPNGPTNLIPSGMWNSLTIIDLQSRSRAQNKIESKVRTHSLDLQRKKILKQLPSSSHIFKSFRKRTRTLSHDKFFNGKKIRDNLPMLRVQIQVPARLRTCDEYRFHFAIPFLGNMIGKFGNVTMSVLSNLHQFLPNGTSIHEHNQTLMRICTSTEEYHLCDNGTEPIIVTFDAIDKVNSSVVLQKTTYGNVIRICKTSSQIMQSFIFYSNYCHPMILNDFHKEFILNAVGVGSGNRSCLVVAHGVTNLYYGNRSFPTLAQPSPTVGPNMCSHHNNFRKNWNACKLASILQLIVTV